MSRIFCASCEQFEPCKCRIVTPVPKTNKTVLWVGAALRAAKFYFSSPREKQKALQDAIDRFNKINNLRTERPKTGH